MPEGDAVWRTCRRLHAGLAGEVITDWDLRWPSVATIQRRGCTTLEVVPRGKHILHRLDDGSTLHSHLRMDGSWRVDPPAKVQRWQLRRPELRALVGCRKATAMGLSLGMIDFVPTRDEHTLVGHLGPDLLGPDWDADVAAANIRAAGEAAIGTALLDQRNLAGIGTIWDTESLYIERLSPWTPVSEMSDADIERIVARAHVLLNETIKYPFSCSTGNINQPTYAYGRKVCGRCNTRLRHDEIRSSPADRKLYWCPRCQARA